MEEKRPKSQDTVEKKKKQILCHQRLYCYKAVFVLKERQTDQRWEQREATDPQIYLHIYSSHLIYNKSTLQDNVGEKSF